MQKLLQKSRALRLKNERKLNEHNKMSYRIKYQSSWDVFVQNNLITIQLQVKQNWDSHKLNIGDFLQDQRIEVQQANVIMTEMTRLFRISRLKL